MRTGLALQRAAAKFPLFRILSSVQILFKICGYNPLVLVGCTERHRDSFYRISHLVVLTITRRTDAKENLEAVSNIVAVVTG